MAIKKESTDYAKEVAGFVTGSLAATVAAPFAIIGGAIDAAQGKDFGKSVSESIKYAGDKGEAFGRSNSGLIKDAALMAATKRKK